MIVLIGMAVGVDYSLFYLKREREERAAGAPPSTRSRSPPQTSGHSILVSGGAVIASMAGLYVIGGRHLQLARHRVDPRGRDRRPRLDHRAAGAARQARPLGRPPARAAACGGSTADRSGRHQPPRPAARSSAPRRRAGRSAAIVVAALAVPPLGMKLHSANLDTLPGDIAEVQTFKRPDRGVPGEGTDRNGRRPASRRRRAGRSPRWPSSSASAAAADDFVAAGPTPLRSPRTARTSVLELAMPYDESDARVDERGRAAPRTELVPAALDDLDVEYAVGGGAAESLDSATSMSTAPARHRLRARSDPADDGARVPQRADRAGLNAAQPGIGRRWPSGS